MKKYYLLFLFFVFTAVHAENDRAFFWQVTSGKTTVYLMGSIHFADKSFYPLRKEIVDAFNESETLVVELDVNKIDANAYSRILAEKGIYKDGSTIKDVVSDETLQQLQQQLEQLNVSYDDIKHYKPGILVLTLTATQVMQMGFEPGLGIDIYFLNRAASDQPAKKIIELETLQQQMDLFLDMPDGELLLKESLHSMDDSESMMGDMVRHWKKGDQHAMEKLLFEDALNDYPAFSKIYDSLFYERNRQMVEKIEAMLKQRQGSYFLVVGSGHLVGDKGIVNTLRDKGYKVVRH